MIDVLHSFVNVTSEDDINRSLRMESLDAHAHDNGRRRGGNSIKFNRQEDSDTFIDLSALNQKAGIRHVETLEEENKENKAKGSDLASQEDNLIENADQSEIIKHRNNENESLDKGSHDVVLEYNADQRAVGSVQVEDEVKTISNLNNDQYQMENLGLDIFGNIIGAGDNTRKHVCDSCFKHDFNYVIQNENICKPMYEGQEIELLILVTTTHKNIKARTALRSTWLSHTKNNTANIRHAFLLGETPDVRYHPVVLKENDLFHDIIKEDFIDSYKNLTYKTIMGFKWAATKCVHAKYVMKTDDDMYVNVNNLLKIFSGPLKDRLSRTIVGACSQKAVPIRNSRSKWYASLESYPDRLYPGFCSGTGYVTSMNVVSKIYEVSPNVPFFHLEDVYVSLCINKLGYRLQHVPGFNTDRQKLDPCIFKGDRLITAHQLSPMVMQILWQKQCIVPINL